MPEVKSTDGQLAVLQYLLNRRDVVPIQIRPENQAPYIQKLFTSELARLGDTLEDALRAHIEGTERLGSYTPSPEKSLTTWGCIDIDGGEEHSLTVDDPDAVAEALTVESAVLGLDLYVEQSASGVGWHLWYFFSEPTPASEVRGLIRTIFDFADMDPDTEGIDIYPKQDRLEADGYGNFVWLPYWGEGQRLWHPIEDKYADVDGLRTNTLFVGGGRKGVDEASTDDDTSAGGIWSEIQTNTPSAPSIETIEAALEYIDASPYKVWIKVLAGLAETYGDRAKELARSWSKDADAGNYDPKEFEKAWGNFVRRDVEGDRKATVGSIVWLASDNGWDKAEWYEELKTEDVQRRTEVDLGGDDGPLHRLVTYPQAKNDMYLAHTILDNMNYPEDVRGAEGDLWRYRKSRGTWERIPESIIDKVIAGYNGLTIGDKSLGMSKSKFEGIKSLVYRFAKASEPWPENGGGVSFINGHLGQKGLVEHSRDHFCRHFVPTEFREGATYPEWDAFLDGCFEGVGTEERALRKALLQEFCGVALMGSAWQMETILLLYGPSGTGKSTFIEVLEQAFPREVRSHVAPQDLSSARKRQYLTGSKLNSIQEINAYRFYDTAEFKKVVSGQQVSGKILYKDEFWFRPRAGWIAASNVLPGVEDANAGFWRRWAVVEFPNIIPPEQRDPGFKERLKDAARDMAWFYAWCWEGYKRVSRRGMKGGYTLPQCHADILQEWQESTDPVRMFAEEKLAPCPANGGTKSSEVYRAYRSWCIRWEIKPLPRQKFVPRLRQLGWGYERRRDGRVFLARLAS